jgi:manganese/zinc/iron transport system ATP- binding protein
MIELLRSLRDQGHTVVVVHHDLQTAPDYFDSLMLLNMRLVAFGPTAQVFNPDLLQKTYGARLTMLTEASERVARTRR